MSIIKTKRVYDVIENSDGKRILVDKIWPRGVKKEDLNYDDWPKEVAPSDGLRNKFHDNLRYTDFKYDYIKELNHNETAKQLLKAVKKQLKSSNVTLLFSSKKTEKNNAVVLKEWLENHMK